jgi:hypothetical protein
MERSYLEGAAGKNQIFSSLFLSFFYHLEGCRALSCVRESFWRQVLMLGNSAQDHD